MIVVAAFTARHGHGPTMRDIGERMTICRSYAHELVEHLRDVGLVSHQPSVHNGAIPTELGWRWHRAVMTAQVPDIGAK